MHPLCLQHVIIMYSTITCMCEGNNDSSNTILLHRRASTRYSMLSKAVPKSIVYTSRYEWKYISRFLKRFWVMNGSLRSYFVWSRNAFNLDNASVSIAITTRFWMGKKLYSIHINSNPLILHYTIPIPVHTTYFWGQSKVSCLH